jgi:hypothetical protein
MQQNNGANSLVVDEDSLGDHVQDDACMDLKKVTNGITKNRCKAAKYQKNSP